MLFSNRNIKHIFLYDVICWETTLSGGTAFRSLTVKTKSTTVWGKARYIAWGAGEIQGSAHIKSVGSQNTQWELGRIEDTNPSIKLAIETEQEHSFALQ